MATKKKKEKPAPAAIPDAACYHRVNPRGGFVGQHSALCAAAGPQATKTGPGRSTCDEPVAVHARFEGGCMNLCARDGELAAERGAVLSAVEFMEERPPRVLHRAVPDEPHDIPAGSEISTPAAGSESSNGLKASAVPADSSTPLLDRILQRSKDNPLQRGELSSKERKLARALAEQGVIIRQSIAGKISYYPIEA